MDATLIAYLVILGGLVLMLAEVLIPSHGALFVVGIVAVAVGVGMTFAYNENSYVGWGTLVAVLVVVPLLLASLVHVWPRTPIGRRLMLTGQEDDETMATMPVHVELE